MTLTLTPDQILLAFTAVSVAYYWLEKALTWLAPRTTSTEFDDRLLAALRNIRSVGSGASSWIRAHAPGAFAVVEDLEQAGLIKTGSKADEYMHRLREAYERITGEKLPPSAEEEARLIAAGLSSADHLARAAVAPSAILTTDTPATLPAPPVPAAGNPPPAPASI